MVTFEFSKQRIFGAKIQIFIKDWIFELLSKIFLIRNPSPSATTCEASGGLFLIFYLKWFSWFCLYASTNFPSEYEWKPIGVCNRCFYFMCGKHFPHPLLASTVAKTQSLIPKAYCPHFGLLWVFWSFYCPKASKSGFYLRLFLRWKHNFSCPKSLGRFPKYPEFKTWKELESLGARMCD